MSLAITVVVALVLVLLGLVGIWRDLRRGVLALAGTLLGGILADFWGDRWGQELADRLGAEARLSVFIVNCALLLTTALVVGYGSGVMLTRSNEPRTLLSRVVGLLLGLLNGVLIVGYVLRFGTADNPGFAEIVGGSFLAQIIHDGLPLMFLAFACIVTLVILGRALMNLIARARAAPAPAPARSAPAPPPATPETGPLPSPAQRQENIQKVLDKINDAVKK